MVSIMNLADPELELIDPTPDIYSMFIHFDKLFFWTKLASGAVVRWSKRMYSCAGVCRYEGRGGLCDIALSEPLLKLRPRKNLVETLLHEMIHAYLFVTGNDRDRDGHGPTFQSHMHRINKATGLNITIYHDFHDEVKLYQTHVWRCDGPCQNRRPYFGIVRRPMNRAPGPSDFWWKDHQNNCAGKFVKIKEPDNYKKKSTGKKPMGDITKFVNNETTKKGLSGTTKLNGGNTVVVTKKDGSNNTKGKFKPTESDATYQLVTAPKITPFTGSGQVLVGNASTRHSMDNAAETVRNVWLKRQETMSTQINTKAIEDVTNKVKEVWSNKQISTDKIGSVNKNKRTSLPANIPPAKTRKIDDYFDVTAKILKDVYGDDFDIHQNKNIFKVAEPSTSRNAELNFVNCPVCNAKVDSRIINSHIDECLNKAEIEKICETDEKINPGLYKQPTAISDSLVKQRVNEEKDFNTPTIDLTRLIDSEETIKQRTNIKPEPPEFLASTVTVKKEPVDIKDGNFNKNVQKCPCCDLTIYTTIEEHLDECLAFFNNNTTIPQEGASTSGGTTIVIDDEDDALDETLTLNATGTKTPCPVCLAMVEQADMNEHLDLCLA